KVKMINSDLTDFVTGHYFRMCSFVQVEKHDLHGASAINTAEAGTGAPDVVYPQKRGDKDVGNGQNHCSVQ
ncbi:TPA: hypothetical protein ACN7MV_004835, partial [Klebsiella pneumoniae]|nr:hypothetical protein [Klebsiella pneumoniae]HBY7217172.1 hypothetical protein [Klebsiella pneumoniae]